MRYLDVKIHVRRHMGTNGEGFARQVCGAACVGLFVTLFGYEFLGGGRWQSLVTLFAIVAVVSGWVIVSRSTLVLAVPMVVLSAVGVVWGGKEALAEGLIAGAGVVAFILAAQVLGDSLIRAGYDTLVRAIWVDLNWRTSWLALAGGYLLSWVFMFTSMPVMYAALYRYDDEARRKRSPVAKDLGILLARAYASAAVATPMGATVLVALAVTSVGLGGYLPTAIPLSLMLAPLALIGMSARLRMLDESDVRPEQERIEVGSRRSYLLLWSLVGALTVMIASVSLLHLAPLAGVSAGVIAIALVWGFLGIKIVPHAPGGFPGWKQELARYGERLCDGALLILAGSIAGTSLARTPAMDWIADSLSSLDVTIVGVVVTVVVVVGLRVVGMPPPAIVFIAGPVLAQAVPLDPPAMAVLLVASATFGFLISPSSLTSAMVSSLTGWSPVEVSLSRQAPFVFLGGVVSCAYVIIVG